LTHSGGSCSTPTRCSCKSFSAGRTCSRRFLSSEWSMAIPTTFFAAIQALGRDQRDESEACFQDIYQMANRAGFDAILTASGSRQLKSPADEDLVQRLGGLANHLDRAFWTFLYRPEYWELACLL